MTAVGIQFVVVHAVAYGTSDGSSGCPSGIPTLLRTNIVSATWDLIPFSSGSAFADAGTYNAYFPVADPTSQPLLGTESSSVATLACFKQTGAAVVGGTLGAICRAAQSAGLQLHLGLAYPFTHLWMYTDPLRRAHLAKTQQAVAQHLHRLYSDTVTIAGYYTALEES